MISRENLLIKELHKELMTDNETKISTKAIQTHHKIICKHLNAIPEKTNSTAQFAKPLVRSQVSTTPTPTTNPTKIRKYNLIQKSQNITSYKIEHTA